MIKNAISTFKNVFRLLLFMIIKKFPEDFVVEEIPVGFNGSGDYAIYRLTKKDYNTESAVQYICKKFNIQRTNVKYAGSKDKHAITKQYISIFKDKGHLKIDNDTIKLEFISFHDEPLSLGSLLGNTFNIRIRELAPEELRTFQERFRQDFVFPNYFDDQRFSDNNYDIGLAILKRDFKKACELGEIQSNGNDYVTALKKIPSKTLLFYIHAVQSYLFNKELSERIMEMGTYHLKEYRHGQLAFLENKNYDIEGFKSIKLAGFDSDNRLLSELGLTSRDFIIKQFPELTVEGIDRDCFVKTNIFFKTYKNESLDNNEMDLEFSLPKGSYATMLIKGLF